MAIRARRLPVFQAPELCDECGGACCSTMPGSTTPDDWGAPNESTMRERIGAALASGRWAVAQVGDALIVRPAVKGREHAGPLDVAVQVAGARLPCTFHGPRGCELPEDTRPSECLSLEPRPDYECEQRGGSANDRAAEWAPHQQLLHEVVDGALERLGLDKRGRKIAT